MAEARILRFEALILLSYSIRVSIPVYVLVAIAAYLLGSIPTGFLLGKARGLDIRTTGSGNIGATNAFRALGTTAGVLVLLIDVLKGWLAVTVLTAVISRQFSPRITAESYEWLRMLAGVCSILGHNFTCWLRFKGGKGIATSAGVLVALVPYGLLIGLGIWALVFAATRYVSLASIVGASVLPPATWLTTGHDARLTTTTGVLALLAIYKHKANIRRLLNGTEHKIGGKKVAPLAAADKSTS